MQVINLGILSDDVNRLEKFVLLEDGKLLFGVVLYHKELVESFLKDGNIKVVAAGTVPEEKGHILEEWGWKSTGYNVVTDVTLRPLILKEILDYKEKEGNMAPNA